MSEDDILKAADLIKCRFAIDRLIRNADESELVAFIITLDSELDGEGWRDSTDFIPIDIVRYGLTRMAEEITRQLKEIT